MYWQEKLLASANENRSESLTFVHSGLSNEEIASIMAVARTKQGEVMSRALLKVFAPVVWLFKELRARAANRRAYQSLVYSDARMLADIGLDRSQLKGAVFGGKQESIFVAAAKAIFPQDQGVEKASQPELKIVLTHDVVAANDTHREAA
jgi:hypothetical protein